MRRNQEFTVYLITKRDILRFCAVEIVIGSITYSLTLRLFHNTILAGAGGWSFMEGLKRLVKLGG